MNFVANSNNRPPPTPPNWSVPPPPLPFNHPGAVSNNNGMLPTPRPNNTNQQFRGPPNQSFLPFNVNGMGMGQRGQMNSVRHNFPVPGNGSLGLGRPVTFTSQPHHQFGNRNQRNHIQGPGHFPSTNQSSFHNREQIRYNSNDLFGTSINNNVNSNGFPYFNPQQDYNKLHNQQTIGQNQRGGQGFQSNRGGRGRGAGTGRGSGGNRNFNNNYKNQRNGDNNRGSPKKKKEKVDKRDLPENSAYYCDICDRGFKTDEKYKEHVDGHQKCSFDDCPYVAAPKLVQLHIARQHRGGLAKKIWNMESEDDIKKWREERKKNYPTPANIQKKKELQAERIKRGEVLETKDFGKMRGGQNRNQGGRGRGRGGGNRFNRRRGRNHNRFDQEEEQAVSSDDGEGPPMETSIVRSSHSDEGNLEANSKEDTSLKTRTDETTDEGKSVKGGNESSLSLLVGYGPSSSEEELSDDGEESVKRTRPSAVNASNGNSINTVSKMSADAPVTDSKAQLFTENNESQLLDAISDKENHDRDIAVPVPAIMSNSENQGSLTRNCQDSDDQNSSVLVDNHNIDSSILESSTLDKVPSDYNEIFSEMDSSLGKAPKLDEDAADDSLDSSRQEDTRRGHKRSHNDKGGRRGQAANKRRRPDNRSQPKSYTLLEKLLAPHIRQERNKILQCVYHIVKNKFFGEDNTTSNSVP